MVSLLGFILFELCTQNNKLLSLLNHNVCKQKFFSNMLTIFSFHSKIQIDGQKVVVNSLNQG